MKSNKGHIKNRGIYKRGKYWYISFYYKGRWIRKSAGTEDFNTAKAELECIKADIMRGKAEEKYELEKKKPKVKFSSFADKYIEYAKTNKKSWKRDTLSIKNLGKYFENDLLSDITSFKIERYKHDRKEIVKPATINRELACLKHMFELAIKWGDATFNPVKQVKLFKEDNQRVRFLYEDEIEKLIGASAEQLKPVIITALNTGMRFGEILNLKWDNIDFKINIINIEETKIGEMRKIPMNEWLKEILTKLKSNSKNDFVFCSKKGEKYKSVRTAFENAVKKAGIKDFKFHDLRHTFASHLVMRGYNIPVVQKLLGHKTIQMTMRYSHLSPEYLKDAVESLNYMKTNTRAERTNTKTNTVAKKLEIVETVGIG